MLMKKVLIMAAAVLTLLTALLVPVPVNAAEADTAVTGTVLKTDTDVEVHQSASGTSEVITVLDAGTAVLVMEDDGEGWCRISAREITGYVESGYLVQLYSSDEMSQEFEQIGNNYQMVFNEVQQLNRQQSQARIWGTVIVVLTVGIFAAGIIPVIRKNKEDEKNREHTETIQ